MSSIFYNWVVWCVCQWVGIFICISWKSYFYWLVPSLCILVVDKTRGVFELIRDSVELRFCHSKMMILGAARSCRQLFLFISLAIFCMTEKMDCVVRAQTTSGITTRYYNFTVWRIKCFLSEKICNNIGLWETMSCSVKKDWWSTSTRTLSEIHPVEYFWFSFVYWSLALLTLCL